MKYLFHLEIKRHKIGLFSSPDLINSTSHLKKMSQFLNEPDRKRPQLTLIQQRK